MCGIFGLLRESSKDIVGDCVSGLQTLSYRGYDSSGISFFFNNSLHLFKEVGYVEALEKKVKASPIQDLPPLTAVIGHTRWATHGKPTKVNAHPHIDEKESISVVHNGIIENHIQLRSLLKEKGIVCKSETDTEVIAHLLSLHYDGKMDVAIREVASLLKGTFAFVAIHKNNPSSLYLYKDGCPLLVGKSDLTQTTYVSSDITPLSSSIDHVYYLDDRECVTITHKGVAFSKNNEDFQNVCFEAYTPYFVEKEKHLYSSFMKKEIFEQPASVARALTPLPLSLIHQDIESIDQVILIGCGSSWHAGLYGAKELEKVLKKPVRALIASEVKYSPPSISSSSLVIAISQSGETADTITAVKELNKKSPRVISICNCENTSLSRHVDATILLNAGPEISVCSTKAFTSQVAMLLNFCACIEDSQTSQTHSGIRHSLATVPEAIDGVLALHEEIESIASQITSYKNIFVLGRSSMVPAALEGALKIKEITYINACGIPAGEMKHGPIALIDSDTLVIGLLGDAATDEKTLSNIAEAASRDAAVLLITHSEVPCDLNLSDFTISLSKTDDTVHILSVSVALQILSCKMAEVMKKNVDKPRNLAKSVTVE